MGALLIAAVGTEGRAMLGAAAAQSMMLAGAALAVLIAGHLAPQWTVAFLSVASGAFVYLGYHAVDFRSAWKPALTGAAGAAVLRAVVPGV